MKNIEYILNDCLNKAMCQKGRIQQPDSNKIAEFVSKYVEAKKLNLHVVSNTEGKLQAVDDLIEFARNNCREWNNDEMEEIIDRL